MVFCTHYAIAGRSHAAVQESRERVQTAVKNAGLHFPRHRIVVNLAPASVSKDGPSYNLPIALGVIILGGYLPQEAVEGTLVVGELSLDGMLRHARGVLPMAATARAEGYRRMFVPEVEAAEAALTRIACRGGKVDTIYINYRLHRR